MGCSIGGRAVLHLALRHGERFRAAIGLQSALYAEDRSLGTRSRKWPCIAPTFMAASCRCVDGGHDRPQSPSAERWETMWHYMQGGPGIFWGDIRYYFDNGDLRNGGADSLSESTCPLYLLSGEYDVRHTGDGPRSRRTRQCRSFRGNGGMGHFPMSNPALFREYLLPVLDNILRRRNPNVSA